MSCNTHVTYPPLNTLKRVASDVWIVDGPAIRFGMPWPKMSFPTRMTVIRLSGGELFIHSPTPLVPALKAEIESIGTPRWIIGPNRIHYWWIKDWKEAYPGASAYLAPRIREQAKGRIDFPAHDLVGTAGYPWGKSIATLPFAGSYMTEFVFFHNESRTLVLTDLIENFEPGKLGFWARCLARLGGALDPDGQTPRDMRLTYSLYSENRTQLRNAVETMLAWQPERVILAHGRWYETNAVKELRRALRWVLEAGGRDH